MLPRDLIELGIVRGAYGVKGWVRVAPLVTEGVVLESVRRWWLIKNPRPQELAVQQVQRRNESIVAKWAGCESKEAADSIKGAMIAVARSDFPALGEGEHYLSDIVGYRVMNREGVELGQVAGVRTGGARGKGGATAQWLEVNTQARQRQGEEDEGAGEQGRALLIPLVDRYVDSIEPEARVVRVDWQSDW